MLSASFTTSSIAPSSAGLWALAGAQGRLQPDTPNCATLTEAQAALTEAYRKLAEREARIEQLESQIQHDELTGLGNKTALFTALRRELALTRRDRKNAGFLVLIQLNDPSAIAQIHGRAVADLFVQKAACTLLNEVRGSDSVCALGCGLFAIVMPQLDAKGGAGRLARLEKNLLARTVHIRTLAIPYEARVGFAFIDEVETPETLMIAADARLYASARHKA